MNKPMTACKVLHVEDVYENRRVVSQILSRLGVTLLEALDGRQAIEIARRELPDLILMDLSLPILDGWQATRLLKSDPLTAGIPIVAVTAHAMMGDEQRARDAGCDDFVTKPLDVIGFGDYVRRRLGS
jgi:two-component system cell cycle response regulator DivK